MAAWKINLAARAPAGSGTGDALVELTRFERFKLDGSDEVGVQPVNRIALDIT